MVNNGFNMTFEESQEYISKRGFDIPWNDCDVFVDERDITRTVANVLKWADKTMIERIRNKFQENICDNYFEMHADFIDEFCKELVNCTT